MSCSPKCFSPISTTSQGIAPKSVLSSWNSRARTCLLLSVSSRRRCSTRKQRRRQHEEESTSSLRHAGERWSQKARTISLVTSTAAGDSPSSVITVSPLSRLRRRNFSRCCSLSLVASSACLPGPCSIAFDPSADIFSEAFPEPADAKGTNLFPDSADAPRMNPFPDAGDSCSIDDVDPSCSNARIDCGDAPPAPSKDSVAVAVASTPAPPPPPAPAPAPAATAASAGEAAAFLASKAAWW
mmetsp:Transcript_36020/g.74060  ORF Transcript_36020/g.74060 Transcript_36020/m.74060 type:complete len:241 (+) Transcript_36020:1565-2287(+)